MASDPDLHGLSQKDLSPDRYGHCRQRADEACCGKETWALEALGDKQRANGRDACAIMKLLEKGGWALVQRQPGLANQHDDRFRQKLNSHGSGVHLRVEQRSQGQGQRSVDLSSHWMELVMRTALPAIELGQG